MWVVFWLRMFAVRWRRDTARLLSPSFGKHYSMEFTVLRESPSRSETSLLLRFAADVHLLQSPRAGSRPPPWPRRDHRRRRSFRSRSSMCQVCDMPRHVDYRIARHLVALPGMAFQGGLCGAREAVSPISRSCDKAAFESTIRLRCLDDKARRMSLELGFAGIRHNRKKAVTQAADGKAEPQRGHRARDG